MFIDPGFDAVVDSIEQRIAAFAMVPVGEPASFCPAARPHAQQPRPAPEPSDFSFQDRLLYKPTLYLSI